MTAPRPGLRRHFRRVLAWFAVPAVLWMAGAVLRIWCRAAAALRVETGTGWLPRATGAAALGVASAAACWLPPYAVIALLVVIVLWLARHLSRGAADSTATP